MIPVCGVKWSLYPDMYVNLEPFDPFLSPAALLGRHRNEVHPSFRLSVLLSVPPCCPGHYSATINDRRFIRCVTSLWHVVVHRLVILQI